jgi:hypothetical protein
MVRLVLNHAKIIAHGVIIVKLILIFVAQNSDIIIVENPSSLVAPVNATAVFSCTARCAPSPCELEGQWIINDIFAAPKLHSRDNLILTLMLNTSVDRKNSKIRCYFDLNVIPISGEHEDSQSATLILTDGEL